LLSIILALCASARGGELQLGEGRPPEPKNEAAPPREIALREFLVLPPPGEYEREPLHRDPIDAAIARGDWKAPAAETTVTDISGELHRWRPAEADGDGWLRDDALRGGYAYVEVDSPARRAMVLEAQGHAMVYVNGAPRAGDPYQNGWLRLPIELQQGKNDLLLHVARGALQARLVAPDKPVSLGLGDATLGDLIVGENEPVYCAVLLLNATDEPLKNVELVASRPGGAALRTPVRGVAPYSTRKIGFPVAGGVSDASRERVPVALRLVEMTDRGERQLDEVEIQLRVRRADEPHVRTFVSDIDGGVQYYAVRPAAKGGKGKPGILLSLHGASVEATSQAAQYSAKPWAHVVAPTNRRPYGFDWEDWGRLDALEVLADAQKELVADPRRTYLSGHSMGGHGTWLLGSTYPDRFAAIGPSAGWVSFWTYVGAPRPDESKPISELLGRGTSISDPLRLMSNLARPGIYILHGQEDDNVPVAQARLMRGQLALFHDDFAYYERPGAKHWWGSECCDWPPMMRFLARHKLPTVKEVNEVDFTTASPGVSARCHWAIIEAQQKQYVPSRVRIELDRDARHFSGETENVARLALDVSSLEPNRPLKLTLDGQTMETVAWPGASRCLWLYRRDDKWLLGEEPPASRKGPERYGSFKAAFNHRVQFVYGTHGAPEENAWALAKARFDAETFYYRGGGSIEVVADRDFDPNAEPDRSVILYGNAETNSAWPALLGAGPVQVRRGVAKFGARPETGDDLACLFVRPRPGSDAALVGVVSGTGLAGMRATDRLRYFVSGIAYPDLLLFDADALTRGADEVRAAGYFDLRWSLDDAEIAWRDLAL
jgi:hypothetical protein